MKEACHKINNKSIDNSYHDWRVTCYSSKSLKRYIANHGIVMRKRILFAWPRSAEGHSLRAKYLIPGWSRKIFVRSARLNPR